MLVLNAEIYFFTQEESKDALPRDLKTGGHLRPAVNFGNDLLFSGEINVNESIDTIQRGNYYEAIVWMPTIENEAYGMIKDLLKNGNAIKLQSASKIIGKGKILNFMYV